MPAIRRLPPLSGLQQEEESVSLDAKTLETRKPSHGRRKGRTCLVQDSKNDPRWILANDILEEALAEVLRRGVRPE